MLLLIASCQEILFVLNSKCNYVLEKIPLVYTEEQSKGDIE